MLHIEYNYLGKPMTDYFHLPNIAIPTHIVYNAVAISADGKEAEYIFDKFSSKGTDSSHRASHSRDRVTTIPWNFNSKGQEQNWFGDIAKTILANL